MVNRLSIEFIESRKPTREAVTKFGGQPFWLDAPQWPTSRATGKPMQFICQIALDREVFPDTTAKMAYLFMTDDDVESTWEPDGSENAVILQPSLPTSVPTQPLETGPSLYRMVKKLFRTKQVPEPCEFSVMLTPSEEPNFVDENSRTGWTEEKLAEYTEMLDGNKIGGSPFFLQNTEWPGSGKWRLLLELDSSRVPFSINFGDMGTGYAFLSEDGKQAKFLWQCF